ncbi:DUF2382 domain-containing protein [Microcoleus sp. FACHB-1515]|uniref:DUF2382 domain-containing protein n=1 Tax=Cyanophyceae TaxID=3028117 RepID=UPI0016845FE3|nr:DUF2382 domain-containing protein [Microcoleus sp. FACHB-1515]MBD2090813.1 DUF2382 domain-containing protein [Microcoleus sp. FACHB-1515]
MALYKLHDFDPSYTDTLEGDDIKGFDVYTDMGDEKLGKVYDVLVDEDGTFRYLILDMGFWVFGKKVLLPIGQARMEYPNKRVYAKLSKQQAESLPEFTDDLKIDYDYEENVRDVYRPGVTGASTMRMGASTIDPLYSTSPAVDATSTGALIDRDPLDAGTMNTAPVSGSYDYDRTDRVDADRPNLGDKIKNAAANVGDKLTGNRDYDRDTYQYDRDPALFGHEDATLKLYQERLLANKTRRKAGEVAVGKHVETETQRVAVPVEKERVVIERVTPGTTEAVAPGTVDFNEGEVARVEVYEEAADIHKEAFVREEVRVRKEVDRETVEAEETLRREELDIDTQGNPVINRDQL